MMRWWNIIHSPCPMEERLEKVFRLLQKMQDESSNILFEISSNYRFVINPDYNLAYPTIKSPNIMRDTTYTYHGDEDQVVEHLEEEADNYILAMALTRYFNADLDEIERASMIAKYFEPSMWKDILSKYGISRKTYYKNMSIAEEKLIELWRLDLYESSGGSGVALGSLVVNQRRTKRTGIPGGYVGQHPEWYLQFINSLRAKKAASEAPRK